MKHSGRRLQLEALESRDVPALPVITVEAVGGPLLEGGSGGRFVFTRSGDLSNEVGFNYYMMGTAMYEDDYLGIGGFGVFHVGESVFEAIPLAHQDGLAEGDETLTVELNTGYGANLDTYVVGTPSTATLVIQDASPIEAGMISGVVWDDANSDGIQNGAEVGLEGITVNLWNSMGSWLGYLTTDTNGEYAFTGKPAGDYQIQVVATGRTFSPQNQGSDEALDSDVDSLGSSAMFSLSGTGQMVVDAGLLPGSGGGEVGGAISGLVWNDADGDGIQDVGEAGTEGITVHLWDSMGMLLDSTTTGWTGEYVFTGRPAGDYQIQVVATGRTFSPQNQGSDEALDSDVDSLGSSAMFSLSGTGQMDVDAGLVIDSNGSVSGRMWADDNGDGIQQTGEIGNQGWIVLTDVDDPTHFYTTLTDSEGYYSLQEITTGIYRVQFVSTESPDRVFGPRFQGADPAIDSDVDSVGGIASLIVSSEQVVTGINAGVFTGLGGAVSGRVWSDDGDGIRQSSEVGADATLELVNTITGQSRFVETNQSGDFILSYVVPGTYQLVFSPNLMGYAFSPQYAGNDPAHDSDADEDGWTIEFVVAESPTVVFMDAGLVPIPPDAENDIRSVDAIDPTIVNLTRSVLVNDFDPHGDATAVLVTSPANGSVVLNPDGSFTYTPGTNFTGTDSFVYQILSGGLLSNSATVFLVAAPQARDDEYSVWHDTELETDVGWGVLLNDEYTGIETLTAVLVSGPVNGMVTLNADGGFLYTPNLGYIGEDTFVYSAQAGSWISANATVRITMTPMPLEAMNDEYELLEDGTINVNAANGVLANDDNPMNVPLVLTVVTPPSVGTLQLEQDGSFTYTPPAGQTAPSSIEFVYQIAEPGVVGAPKTAVVKAGVGVAAQRWRVVRDIREDYAEAHSGDPTKDTIAGLAKRVGLEPNEAVKWLNWNVPGTNYTPAQNAMFRTALKNPNKTVQEIFGAQTKFYVPNVVMAYWGGELATFGRNWVDWNRDMNALTLKGYKVLVGGYDVKGPIGSVTFPRPSGSEAIDRARYIKWQTETNRLRWNAGLRNGWIEKPMPAKDFLAALQHGTDEKFLYGVVLWGHGDPNGLLLNAYVKNAAESETYSVSYDQWSEKQNYKLGLGILFACHTSESMSAARKNAGTNVFSTNGIFWGSNGDLIPPLTGPIISRVLRRIPGIRIGKGTINPPSVDTVLLLNRGIE